MANAFVSPCVYSLWKVIEILKNSLYWINEISTACELTITIFAASTVKPLLGFLVSFNFTVSIKQKDFQRWKKNLGTR